MLRLGVLVSLVPARETARGEENETLAERAGGDYSRSRMHIIVCLPPVPGIGLNFPNPKPLAPICSPTPPMPPPQLGHDQVEVEVDVEVELLRVEQRAEQRREELLEQPWEQVKVEVKVEVEVQVEIEVKVEVEIERTVQLTTQVSTQPALLPPELPGEKRTILRRTQARLRRKLPLTSCQFPVAGRQWRAGLRPRSLCACP
jgi:hypothetical protein